MAAVMAADGVVLPMPMSPPAMRFGAGVGLRIGSVDANFEAADGVLPAHGGATGDVGSAVTDLGDGQAGLRVEVHGHAGVDHGDIGAGVAGQRVDGRAAGHEVEDHLRRDFGGKRGHALGSHAVVTGDHDDRLAGDLRDGLAQYAGQLD